MEAYAPVIPLMVSSAPLVLVYLIGTIYALVKLRDYPKPATFALIGFIGELVATGIRAAGTVMTFPAYRGTLTLQETATRLAAINLLAMVLVVAATVMLLIAIFTDRETKK